MDVDRKVMYAFRGWIAFVAFMDLGTAVRSYIEKRSFLSKTISDLDEYVDGIYNEILAQINCKQYVISF